MTDTTEKKIFNILNNTDYFVSAVVEEAKNVQKCFRQLKKENEILVKEKEDLERKNKILKDALQKLVDWNPEVDKYGLWKIEGISVNSFAKNILKKT